MPPALWHVSKELVASSFSASKLPSSQTHCRPSGSVLVRGVVLHIGILINALWIVGSALVETRRIWTCEASHGRTVVSSSEIIQT